MSDQLAGSTTEQVAEARRWFDEYDGPRSKNCDPDTGEWWASIGVNAPSGRGVRGLQCTITSAREVDCILGVWMFWKAVTR